MAPGSDEQARGDEFVAVLRFLYVDFGDRRQTLGKRAAEDRTVE